MNDEGSESDRYSNDTMASILEEALKPYAEEERLIFLKHSRVNGCLRLNVCWQAGLKKTQWLRFGIFFPLTAVWRE